ncbi:MAG: MFS transporter [Chloroflexota bacterium]
MPVVAQSASQAEKPSVIPLYALQVLSYAGNALALPYVNLYVVASGVSASTLGILLSIGSMLEILIPPALSALADRYQRHRVLFIGFIGSLVVGNLLLAWFDQFIMLAIAVIAIEMVFRPSLTLGMQLVISRMEHESRQIVGRVRSFSSFGFGIASLLANRLFAFGGYFALFMSAAATFTISLGLTRSLPEATTEKRSPKAVGAVPRSRGFYLLAVGMFFMLMAHRVGYAFWFVHFQQNLGLSTEVISLLIAFLALIEIPFFILLDRILPHVNLQSAFLVGGVGMGFVWLFVGIVPNQFWLYILMIMRGAMFATFLLTTFLVIARVSHPENVATNQALLQGTIPGFATLLTAPLAGWAYDNLGAPILFTTIFVTIIIGIVISLPALRYIKNNESEA